MTLTAQAVEHSFASQPVLRGVSFALEEGERVALIGPNGAGKTTLLRILAGLLQPDAGSVSLGERPLASMSRAEIAREVSVIPQAQPGAFGFSAIELVLMGFHARQGRFSLESDAQHREALQALEKLEIAHLADRPMTQLSGGEAQRVVMARTIVSGARCWLLDEPTSNLDLRHQIALLAHVESHCGNGGSALAIVHDPNLAQKYFDRVLILHDGAFMADGPPTAALTEDSFEKAFGLKMKFVGEANEGAWVPRAVSSDPTGPSRVETGGNAQDPGVEP